MELAERRALHLSLSTRLALMSDRELLRRLKGAAAKRGWGATRTLELDGHRVFAKSLPVTDRELADAHGTRNLYRLPAHYHYGVGSAGFGAFREVAAHVKASGWVLAGEIDSFPLLYHQRILAMPDRARAMDDARLERYARYWNGSKTVAQYMRERQQARHVVVLLLEHVPDVMHAWLGENLDRLDDVIADSQRAIEHMRQRGVIHFDAQQHNLLIADGRVRFGDFGLWVDRDFELDARERAFFDRHRHYDHGELVYALLYLLVATLAGLPPQAREHLARRHGSVDPIALLQKLEDIPRRDLPLDPRYAYALLRFRPIMLEMDRLYSALRRSRKPNAIYDDRRLRRLLKQAGVL